MSKRVIVIDDDATYCKIIKRQFKDALSFDADITQNEHEMYQMIADAEASSNPYYIATIDMDFKAPGSDDDAPHEPRGREIVRHIKANYPHIICLMISGAPIKASEALMLRDDYGLDFFLEKTRLEPAIFRVYVDYAIKHHTQYHGSSVMPVAGKKIFISYRRGNAWGQARAIHDRLERGGHNVFLDIDDIPAGDFPARITRQIVNSDYFIILLGDNTLDSEWVRKELDLALQAGVEIIPILLDGFQMTEETVGKRYPQLLAKNAIEINPANFVGALDRLLETFIGASV